MSLIFDLYRTDGRIESFEFNPLKCREEHDFRPFLKGVSEEEYVSAVLHGDDPCLRDGFELWVGDDPDVRASLPALSPSEEGLPRRDFTFHKQKGFDIFRDTIGVSCLKLFRQQQGGGRCVNKLVLSVPIEVKASKEREEIMIETVRELARIAPQTIHSKEKGQNLSPFELDWTHGAASMKSPRLELDEIWKLLVSLQPLLLKIIRSPAYSVTLERRLCELSRVRKWDFLVARQYERQLSRVGEQSLERRMMVRERRHVSSLVSPVHCGILSFLKKLRGRLSRIHRLAKSQCGERHERREKYRKAAGVQSWIEDESRVDVALFNRLGKCERVLDWLISNPFWKGSEQFHIPLHALPAESFSGNACYQRLYQIMRDFERKHFWWIPLEEAEGIVALLRENGGNSVQRKYSILYEYWCFWRLVHAFESFGFNFDRARLSLRHHLAQTLLLEPERMSMEPAETEEFEIKLVHDFQAFRQNMELQGDEKFFIKMIRKGDKKDYGSMLTPDFALKIRNKKTGKWFWMLMDAKSVTSLGTLEIDKRNKYLTRISYRISKTDAKDPDQSWLFYSGGAEPGIEGTENDNEKNYSWHSELDADKCFGENGSFVCNVESGIVKQEYAAQKQIQFRGHVRANAVSCPLSEGEKDPFSQFARIQMETAKRYLGSVEEDVSGDN